MALVECTVVFNDVECPDQATWTTVAAVKAAANQVVEVVGFRVDSDGTAGDAAMLDWRIAHITAASGSGTNTPPKKSNTGWGITPTTVGTVDYASEPTIGDIVEYGKFHAQGGRISGFVLRPLVVLDGGDEVAFSINNPTGAAHVNVSGAVYIVE